MSAQTWPCPACAEPILVEADVCKHCGARMEDYDDEPAPQVSVPRRRSPLTRWPLAVALVAVVPVLWARGTFDQSPTRKTAPSPPRYGA
jgi:hypothetical protein